MSTSALAIGRHGAAASRNDYPRISLLSLAHMTNDMSGSLITSLTPYLVIQGRITTATAGLVLLVYLFGSSVLQPIFGHMSDRSGRRLFVVAGPLWVGIAAALVGWASNSVEVLALAGIGGIGTAAFHPQAASMVHTVSTRNRGWTMSIFAVGGNLGFAIGPVMAAIIALVGLHWTLIVLVPGFALTVLLSLYAPRLEGQKETHDGPDLRRVFRESWGRLSLIVSIIATRSSVQFALIIFLPLYYHAQGGSAQQGSYYAFVLSLSGALGGLLGGRLSDRFGRRVVVVASLLASAPLLLLALSVNGPLVWPLLAVAGACLLASNSVTVVQGQELLPENTGIASGLTLGLGFGLSGVFSSILTALSDHIGVHTIVFLVPFLAIGAACMGALVSPRKRVA